MDGRRSNFISLIREICSEENIEIKSFSDGWAHQLKKNGKQCYIVGYQFPVNKASSKEICQDKVLTYEVLTDAGIPAAEHLFLPKWEVRTVPEPSGIVKKALSMLERDGKIVLKDNYGTGGNKVFLIEDENGFYETLELILQGSYAASLSPFYEIEEEYRVVMTDGDAAVIFRKERASETDENGRKHYLTWKHNLGQGATGILEYDPVIRKALSEIAQKTAETLDMTFCSVDIIRVNGAYMVLEVNGGVMMEHFSGQNEECRALAKAAYRRAILKAME